LTRSELRRAAQMELGRRRRAAAATLGAFTALAVAGEHERQLALIQDASAYIVALCSRRAGKTYALAVKALLLALARPRQNILYIGLSKPHARKFLWEEVWKPLLSKWRIECKTLEDEMTTRFPNGSIVYVSGTDDVRHIESFLGNRLNLAIVDEAQSQADSVLVPLCSRILPNALLDDGDRPGQLIMSGTIPEVNAGQFMAVWRAGRWSQHNWSRFENPHLRDQRKMLALYLAANPGLTEDSPEVQREWFGRFKFDPKATAYRYSPDLNGYRAMEPAWLAAARMELERKGVPIATLLAAERFPGVQHFSVGIDPGSVDRASLVCWGWGDRSRDVQQVFEWSTARGAHATWGQIAAVAGLVQRHFTPGWWFYDAGSSKNELDTFQRDYGINVIKAATKTDLPGQVRRNNDLLTQGRLKVMAGGAVEEDYMKARWDADARAHGQWKWANAWHPDPSEAGRYGLQGYFDAFEPRDERLAEERQREAFMAEDPDEFAPDAKSDPLASLLAR
jgi:hypothetical protein